MSSWLNKNRLFALLAVSLLLLALLLRLRGLDTTGLWGDQAFTLNTAMRWVNGGPLPLAANKSSIGLVNPPLIEYLYAAALFLWRDILSVSWLTLLGGLAAVAVTGFVTTRLFGRRAGLWAMLAFAVAPWAVFWSQLIWNQTMVPPFAALALGGLLLYLFDRPRAVYIVVSFAAAAAMTQVHPGSAVQLLTMALALLLCRRRVDWRHVLAGAAVFALLYLPYLLYQMGTGWADLAAARAVAGQEAAFSSAAFRLSLDLIRAQGLYRAVPGVVAFDVLAAVLFVAALGVVGWQGWNEGTTAVSGDPRREAPAAASGGQRRGLKPAAARQNPLKRVEDREQTESQSYDLTIGARLSAFVCRPSFIILLWFALPLLFYWRSGVYLQNYYLIGQWPAHFMIMGIGLDAAQRWAERRAGRWASGAVALPFVALVAYQVFFSLRYQDARTAGDGPPLQVRHARGLIAQSRRLLDERPDCRLVGLGRGHQVETSDLALLVEFTDPARVLLADGDLALPRPSPCAVYLDARPGSLASYALAAEATPIAGAGVTVKDQTWQFYDWVAPPAAPPGDVPRWDAGVALLGSFRGDMAPGQDTRLVLTWDITGEPGRAYHFGVYLLDAAGQIVAQHDGPGFDSIQWRPGDGFVTYHPLSLPDELPPGDYRLAVALYTWPDLVRSRLASREDTAYLETVAIEEK